MKLGLVLEGGASRTYFSIGIMDALMEEGIYANYVIGASAGIANGISYISKQKGRSLEIALKYMNDKRYMGFKHLLNPKNKSYYNVKFVFDDIPNKYVPFDYEEAKKFKGDCIAVVTNLETGEPEYIPVTYDDKKWPLMVATCSLPIMFKSVRMNDKIYMDGGICDPIPVKKAIEDGCDKMIVIITREKEYVKEEEAGIGMSAFLYRKYPNFVKALKSRTNWYNESHKEVEKLENEKKAFVFRPVNTDGWKRTESDPKMLVMMYETGYKMAKDRMSELKEYIGIDNATSR